MKAYVARLMRRAADKLDASPAAQQRRLVEAMAAPGGPVLTDEKMAQCTRALTRLQRAGHVVTVKNGGLHLQLRAGRHGLVEFWPTTGKWWIGALKMRGQGLDALLREIGGAA